ncbi:MAG: hypothetical protein DRI84_04485 [Bacteroidetes bacterium]|nr:MAG: hypothetical protein DRI84_04485 [Bacteroidota bacterium]
MEFPPRYVIADDEPIQMKVEDKEGEEITVNAVYTWEQDSWNILQVFHFFPSKRQLCLYNKEHDLKWTYKEEYEDEISSTMPIQFNVPMWKYWLATISILIILALIFISFPIQSFLHKLSSYKYAKKVDTFKSYKDFLLIRNTPAFLRRKAEVRLKNKVDTYKKFLQVVTLKTSGELKEVIFKIIDSIGKTGNVNVNVQFQPDIKVLPQPEFLNQNVVMLEKLLNSPLAQTTFPKWRESLLRDSNLTWSQQELDLLFNTSPDIDKVKTMLELKKDKLKLEAQYKYADVTKFFSKSITADRQKLFIHYLNNLFKVVFPERIINIHKDCDSLITFHVKSMFRNMNTYNWWVSDEKIPVENRPLQPNVECSWEFYASIKDPGSEKTTFVSNTISSTTTYPLYSGKRDLKKLYMYRFVSAFAKFGEEIAEAFGMYRSSSVSKTKSVLPPGEIYSLFEEQFKEFLTDQAMDTPVAIIEEFFGEYESSLEGLLISVEYTEQLITGLQDAISGGIEVGTIVFDIIGGALSNIGSE